MRYELRLIRDGFAIEAGFERGKADLPDWFVDAPELDGLVDAWIMDAFWALSTTRSYGMAVGPIPWHHIVAYARWRGLDPENEPAFVAIIRQMDAAYLDWQSKEQPKAPPKAEK